MERKLLIGLVFCLAMHLEVQALTPPNPVKGTAFFCAREFVTGCGDVLYTFMLPDGWGMGVTKTMPDGNGHYMLFPMGGGYGCSVDIKKFKDANEAEAAYEENKKAFKIIWKMNDGFESDLKTAKYACRVSGQYMIEIWYAFPKAKTFSNTWNGLKNSVFISYKQ